MNLRRFLILLGILGTFILVMASLGSLDDIVKAFTQVHWYVIPMFIVVQIYSYYSNAKYYQNFFAIFGRQVPFRYTYEMSLAVYFANQTIPSGGVSGTTYLGEALKRYDVAFGKATLAQLGRFFFTFWSFFVTLGLGFLILFLTGDFDRVSTRFVVLLIIAILAVGLVLFTVISDRRRLEALLTPLLKLLNFLGRVIFRRQHPVLPPAQLEHFLGDFYHGYREIMSHKREWPRLLWWTLSSVLAEAVTVYAIFIGFGHFMNPGVVLAGYSLSIIASVAGFFAGGLAVYEAGMIGTFTVLQVAFPLAFAVTIMYRALNLAIFVPIGLHFYRQHLKEAK